MDSVLGIDEGARIRIILTNDIVVRKENPMIYWVAAVTEGEDAEVVVYDLIVAKTAEDAILRFSLEHADFLKAYPTARCVLRPF